MKKGNAIKGILTAMLVMMLLVTAACSKGNNGGNSASPSDSASPSETASASPSSSASEEPSQETKEPIKLTMLVSQKPPVDFKDTEVGQEIQKRFGITIEWVDAEDEKIKVMLASGDFPDIVMLKPEYQARLIEGGQVYAMDDYLDAYGKNITANVPKVVDFMRKFRSNGTNKLYFLPVNSGPDMMGFEASLGVNTRWDYYKELGFPAIKNEDDLLAMLKQMQEKHPKTDDGQKVYGVGFWNDWGLWDYYMPMAITNGFSNWGPNGYLVKQDTNEIINNYTNPDSPLWKTVSFYYKAKKMGLVDPDSFTMKSGDFQAKMANGTILYAPASWFNGDFNGKNNAAMKGYAVIPMEGGYQWNGADQLGWFDKSLGISKKNKYPERTMELLDFLWSFEGNRLAYSGVQGVHWDVVDGAPTLTEMMVKAQTENGDVWRKTGVRGAQTGIMSGLGNFVVDPEDNTEVDLFSSAKSFEKQLTPLTKDFSEHYGVKYPAEIFLKNVEEGKSINQKNMDTRISAALPNTPDDIARIDSKLDELMTKAVAKAINAKSDADFDSVKQKTMDNLKSNGVDQSNDYWMKTWEDTKAAVNK
ncbi:hypothetical protein D7Z26_18765 [Cohnella endophytica]|uniref:Extracellular solute-binding protein n=1 Tax=Cohnella endophytica TaxID=2419778 RepID=A0A494XQS7_9BACL|nr:hypothetical protein [Cohnella endophytica]RKP49873.1 hypothetical protein D7Z26_18765 [Cohnella endophytica]